jgi:hypothetical protein
VLPLTGRLQFTRGLVSTAVALAVAAAFLFPIPLPAPLRQAFKRGVAPFLCALRTIHSGYIGDYITFLMIGAMILLLAYTVA